MLVQALSAIGLLCALLAVALMVRARHGDRA
jgi:hypothetical protein